MHQKMNNYNVDVEEKIFLVTFYVYMEQMTHNFPKNGSLGQFSVISYMDSPR